MNARKFLGIIVALVAAGAACLPAHAQLFRAYLTSGGSDANPCTLSLPCRLLPAALAAVADGGEIWMLDSANYNTAQVDVTKSVTILAIPGALGSLVATGGGDAIKIDTPGVKVALRNLVIVHLTSSANGVNLTQGDALHVSGCEISGMQSRGIVAYVGKVTVKDTVLRDNLYGFAAGTSAVAELDRVLFRDNGSGIFVSGGRATISNSVFSGNATGVQAFSNGGGVETRIAVDGSVLAGNTYGIFASAALVSDLAEVAVSRNVISNSGSAAIYAASANTNIVVWWQHDHRERDRDLRLGERDRLHARHEHVQVQHQRRAGRRAHAACRPIDESPWPIPQRGANHVATVHGYCPASDVLTPLEVVLPFIWLLPSE
jgi:hypothetical protein